MRWRHIALIAGYSARFSVRGGIGLVFLLMSLTFGLMVAHLMLQPVEIMMRDAPSRTRDLEPVEQQRRALDKLTEQATPVVAWMLSTKPNETASEPPRDATGRRRNDRGERDRVAENWADYLLHERPALLSAIFLVLLLGWPLVVALGAFDLFAGDIGSRQLRYQLLRADRSSIFFGRLLGMLLTFVMVLLLVTGTVTVYIGCKLPVYPWSELLGWAAYGSLALLVASAPYIALCAWVSAAVSGPFTAVTVASLAIGGVPLVAAFGKVSHEAVGYVNYLLPWGYQMRLFHPEPAQVALAAAGCAATTAVFVWLGHRKFTRRDL
jgi:ABC-type transport system involved in multi-copper enzyme maturation permease subunit